MVKTQICLSALATAALCKQDYLSIIRKNPNFFMGGDWQVDHVTHEVINDKNYTITAGIPSGNMTFYRTNDYETVVAPTKWLPEDIYKNWNEDNLGLSFNVPPVSSYDYVLQGSQQGKIRELWGRSFRIADLKAVESDAKHVNVSFTFSWAEYKPEISSHWNNVTLSRLVPTDSIKEEKVTIAKNFDPVYDKEGKRFFEGRWRAGRPFSEEDIARSMCCVPYDLLDVNSTNTNTNNATIKGWIGKGCDLLNIETDNLYQTRSEFSFPKINMAEGAKPFQTDFKKLVITAKNRKSVYYSDGSVHETFDFTTDFSAYNSTIKPCTVTMRRRKPLLLKEEKSALRPIKN